MKLKYDVQAMVEALEAQSEEMGAEMSTDMAKTILEYLRMVMAERASLLTDARISEMVSYSDEFYDEEDGMSRAGWVYSATGDFVEDCGRESTNIDNKVLRVLKKTENWHDSI